MDKGESKWMQALKNYLPLREVESISQDNALWAVIWLQPTNHHFIPIPIWELKMPTQAARTPCREHWGSKKPVGPLGKSCGLLFMSFHGLYH